MQVHTIDAPTPSPLLVRPPDVINEKIDPNTCEVIEGHQHDPSGISSLGDSIVALGQLYPTLLLEYPDGRRLIAAGRRRWMACKERGLELLVNIWYCSDAEDVNLELFAKAVRIAENNERCDPSAMDIAIQLRAIRSEPAPKVGHQIKEVILGKRWPVWRRKRERPDDTLMNSSARQFGYLRIEAIQQQPKLHRVSA